MAEKRLDGVPDVFMVSGGRTSAYMAIKYSSPGDILIFADTGREAVATHVFLNDVESYLGRKIIRTMYPGGFDALVRHWKSVPNQAWRFCTIQLKIAQCKRELRRMGIQSFNKWIGFRYDEYDRFYEYESKEVKVGTVFPLVSARVVKAEVLRFFREDAGFDLNLPAILGNCSLCPLKGKEKIKAIMRYDPGLAVPWINDELVTGHTYFKDVSYSELLRQAKAELSLFPDQRFEDMTADIACTCGHGI